MTKPDITVNKTALADTTVCITGTLDQLTRKEAEELVIEAGGKISSTVTKNTDVLIAGEKAGSKLIKAKELEIPIRREKDFIKAIAIDYSCLFFYPTEPEEQQPDWEEDLIKGEELARCVQQLLDNNEAEDVALVLGYKYMDGKGHDQPLLGHMMKAVHEAGVDLEEDETPKAEWIDIYKGKLIKHLDHHGTSIRLSKAIYDESPQDYDHACDWEELEEWEDYHIEPMMCGDITTLVYIGNDMEFSEMMSDEEMFDYYDIPSEHINWTCGYG